MCLTVMVYDHIMLVQGLERDANTGEGQLGQPTGSGTARHRRGA